MTRTALHLTGLYEMRSRVTPHVTPYDLFTFVARKRSCALPFSHHLLQIPHPLIPFPEVAGFPPLHVRRNLTPGRPKATSGVPYYTIARVPGVPNRPTISQLLSILASYQNPQDLSSRQGTIPGDIGGGSLFRVPLRQLKKLCLEGDCCSVFRLLDQLEYPDKLDLTQLDVTQCGDAVSELLEAFLRNRIRRDVRFQSRLANTMLSPRH